MAFGWMLSGEMSFQMMFLACIWRDVFPNDVFGLHFREEGVAVAKMRQAVVFGDGQMERLDVTAAFAHHGKQEDGGYVRLPKNLPHKTFHPFRRQRRAAVVDGKFDADDVWFMDKKMLCRAMDADVGTCRADARVVVGDGRVGKIDFPPIGHLVAPTVFNLFRVSAFRDAAADDDDGDWFAFQGTFEDMFESS